jgi:hypothetical protein
MDILNTYHMIAIQPAYWRVGRIHRKHTSCDHYPHLSRHLGHGKRASMLRNLATDCLPRICLREQLFTNTLPSDGCTCNNCRACSTHGEKKNAYKIWLGNLKEKIIRNSLA